MKLRFPFRKKMKNDALTEENTVLCEESVCGTAETMSQGGLSEPENAPEVPTESEPIAALGAKVEQLEAKLSESERARGELVEELRRYVEEVNKANRESSAGSVKGSQSDYFSYSEVKEMTPEEVRKNFSRIVDSMGKWN